MREIAVFICDDEPAQLKQLATAVKTSQAMLVENNEERSVIFQVKQASSYHQAVALLAQMPLNSIYLLDIELSENAVDPTGIDLAEQIKQRDSQAKIIFVTNYRELSYLTYERRIGAVDYVVKDLAPEKLQARLNDTLSEVVTEIESQPVVAKKFSYKMGRRVVTLPLSQVIALVTATNAHKLILVKDSGQAMISGTIGQVAADYPELWRISQSCLVNRQQIQEVNVHTNELVLTGGLTVKYSRSLRQQMQQLAKELLKR